MKRKYEQGLIAAILTVAFVLIVIRIMQYKEYCYPKAVAEQDSLKTSQKKRVEIRFEEPMDTIKTKIAPMEVEVIQEKKEGVLNIEEKVNLELAAQGSILVANIGEHILVGDLYGDGHELIVAEVNMKREALPCKGEGGGSVGVAKVELAAFRYHNEEWTIVWQYPMRYLGNNPEVNVRGIAWTVGDTDNDGREEILIFEQRTLLRHEWNGSNFEKVTFLFPEIIDQAIVGNLDSENGDELITFGLTETYDSDRYYLDPSYTLQLYQSNRFNYELIWQDSKRMGYSNTGIIPPDKLVTIGNVENTGKNQLVVMHAQSDVSPSHYDFIMWEDAGLELKKSVILALGKSWDYDVFYSRKPQPETPPYIVGDFQVIDMDKKTILLTRNQSWSNVAIRLEEDKYKLLDLLPRDVLRYRYVVWINIDGKGKGFLCINGNQYHFYRRK